jgi:hypothetical protein
MVLYDVAHRVCKMKNQDVKRINEVIDVKHNSASDVCEEMNKILSELTSEVEGKWVPFLKVKFENSSNCELACLEGNVTNPLCVYILKGNTWAMTYMKGELLFFVIATHVPGCMTVCLAACSVVYGAQLTLFFAK